MTPMPTSSFTAPLADEPTTGHSKLLRSIQILTAVALVSCLLAMTIFKTGARHDFCLGLTVGVLLALLAQTFFNRDR